MDKEQQEKLNDKLAAAVYHNWTASVQLLLAAGADVNAENKQNTPVFYTAVSSGYVEIAKLLINAGADVNIKNKHGLSNWTPLHCASRDGHTDCVRLLIETGADIDIRDHYGRTPLHHAAAWGNIECMLLLIEAGTDTNLPDRTGETPFDILKRINPQKYSEYINSLIEAQPESRRLKSEDASGVPSESGFEFEI